MNGQGGNPKHRNWLADAKAAGEAMASRPWTETGGTANDWIEARAEELGVRASLLRADVGAWRHLDRHAPPRMLAELLRSDADFSRLILHKVSRLFKLQHKDAAALLRQAMAGEVSGRDLSKVLRDAKAALLEANIARQNPSAYLDVVQAYLTEWVAQSKQERLVLRGLRNYFDDPALRVPEFILVDFDKTVFEGVEVMPGVDRDAPLDAAEKVAHRARFFDSYTVVVSAVSPRDAARAERLPQALDNVGASAVGVVLYDGAKFTRCVEPKAGRADPRLMARFRRQILKVLDSRLDPKVYMAAATAFVDAEEGVKARRRPSRRRSPA